MRVTVEKQPQSSVTLDIVTEPEEFAKAMDRAFRRVNQQVRIPGFRPGKAPRFIVEQRIGREIIVDEAQRDIMDDLYRQALEQEDIVPVSDPEVDVYQDEPLGFKVQVQVYPEVELGDYQAVRVEPREVEVTDEDVEAVLENIQKANSIWVEPETARPPHDGDQVTLDLAVTDNGEPFQEPLEGGTFVIGESQLFPQIEEALKSLHAGESAEFDISFAEDDEKVNPELRGKTLHYALTLTEIKERELPEIDDDLAKTAGEFETLDELRADIRKDLLRTRATEARTEVVNTAIERLAEGATVSIPEAMVDRQLNDEIERLKTQLPQSGSSLDEFLRFENKTLDEYKESQRDDAERRLLNSLVLEAFAKAEDVEVSDDDLMAEIDRLTAPTESAEHAEQMREIYSSPYFRGMIVQELTNRKVTDRLIEVVTEGQGAVTGEGAEALKALEQPAAETVEVTGEAEAEEAEAGATEADAEESEAPSLETATEMAEAGESAAAAELDAALDQQAEAASKAEAAEPTDDDSDVESKSAKETTSGS